MAVNVRIGHVAVPARDLEAIAGFYSRLIGLEPNLQGSLPALGDFVFLAGRADDALPLLCFTTREGARHVALEVDSLSALQAVYADATRNGLPIAFAMNHVVSVSLYLLDPEGNMVEVFWATGEAADGPHAFPLAPDDLGRPEAELRELIATPPAGG